MPCWRRHAGGGSKRLPARLRPECSDRAAVRLTETSDGLIIAAAVASSSAGKGAGRQLWLGGLRPADRRVLVLWDHARSVLCVRDRGAADENSEDEEPEGCGHARPERIRALGPRGCSGHRRPRSPRWRDRFLERCAHALPKFGIDERKLRTDRFPGHAYPILAEGCLPSLGEVCARTVASPSQAFHSSAQRHRFPTTCRIRTTS